MRKPRSRSCTRGSWPCCVLAVGRTAHQMAASVRTMARSLAKSEEDRRARVVVPGAGGVVERRQALGARRPRRPGAAREILVVRPFTRCRASVKFLLSPDRRCRARLWNPLRSRARRRSSAPSPFRRNGETALGAVTVHRLAGRGRRWPGLASLLRHAYGRWLGLTAVDLRLPVPGFGCLSSLARSRVRGRMRYVSRHWWAIRPCRST